MDYRLRFWVEHLSPSNLESRAGDLLRDFKPGINVAFFERYMDESNAASIRRMKDEGVEIAYWPLLGRGEGYFPNERNSGVFAGYVRRLVSWAFESDAVPDYVAVDLELPFDQMGRMLKGSAPVRILRGIGVLRDNADRFRYRSAKEEFARLVEWLHSKGIGAMCAVLPWVAVELMCGGEFLQDVMETPVSGIDWDIISPMWYASMFEGLTGGMVTQKDVNWLAFESSLSLREKFGERVGISLGVTGTGILGTEKTFESCSELIAGIGASLAAGVKDISVYNLEGILERENPSSWISIAMEAEPVFPEESRKARAVLSVIRGLAGVSGLIGRP